ncbi:hypothetical protein [Nonlabens antarcticus]|uniref:hypothetical protein n=1 Tax=Nonlabens antarcticus TaxID=392714 RepID=UPI001891D07F|nr:hypothetical protein [Nonlabens antarcticus]
MNLIYSSVAILLVWFSPSVVDPDCPEGADQVIYTCGGSSCVNFPDNWNDDRKLDWAEHANDIRCSGPQEVLIAEPLN